MTARDVVGRELKVGQEVAYCLAGVSQNFRVAKILKISPKTVELDAKAYQSDFANNLRRNHTAVAIVKDVPMVCTCKGYMEGCSSCFREGLMPPPVFR